MLAAVLPSNWRQTRIAAGWARDVRELRPRRSMARPPNRSSARRPSNRPQEVQPPVPEETTVTADKLTTQVDDPGPSVAALETIVSLSKRRGFIFPSSEIYGGINAVWDYGQLGVELKNNVKQAWWRAMVQERTDIVGLDARDRKSVV